MKLRVLVFSNEEYTRTLLSVVLRERGYDFYLFPKEGTCPLSSHDQCPCPEGYSCADVIITDVSSKGNKIFELLEEQKGSGCKIKSFGIISRNWTAETIRFARDIDCFTFREPFSTSIFEYWLESCEKEVDSDRQLWNWDKSSKSNTDEEL